eukprot:491664-Rhodomonas_salina.2
MHLRVDTCGRGDERERGTSSKGDTESWRKKSGSRADRGKDRGRQRERDWERGRKGETGKARTVYGVVLTRKARDQN